MSRLVSLDQVVERAQAHGIAYERLQSAKPTVSLQPCPGCRDGFDALVEWDGVGLVYVCNGCHDPVGIRDALLADPETRPEPRQVSELRLYSPAELLAFAPPEWLVEPFIVDGALSILFGPSGTFKSFCAVDWAARAPGAAVYISAEGSPRRFGERIAAWVHAAGQSPELWCVPHSVDLLDRDQFASLCAVLEPVAPRLVVVDTAARNMSGDENKTVDMSALVRATDELRRRFGCAVLVLHHSGHENTDRERGSSALRGAADVSIRAKKQDGLRVRLECAKARDFEEFEAVIVRFEPVAGSLVACQPVRPAESIEADVRRHLADHPEASQNDVERAVKGGKDLVRAAYKRARQVRRTAPPHPELGAAEGVRPVEAAPPPQFQPDPTDDPDEHMRRLEDGGF